MYQTLNKNQAKYTDSQEKLATRSNGVRITTAPNYADTVPVQEKEIEEFLTMYRCNKRLAILNLTLSKIKFKGYWRASHSYIADLLNVSSDYVQETLDRSMSLGIIRSKRTFNGSSIYTFNSEFTKSGIVERLRKYFPGMRSLLSLLSLLSCLPNCSYANSIHAYGQKTRTGILSESLRSINYSYNIESSTREGFKIGKITETELTKKEKNPEKCGETFKTKVHPPINLFLLQLIKGIGKIPETNLRKQEENLKEPREREENSKKSEETFKTELYSSSNPFLQQLIKGNVLSLNKETPVALPPSEKELVEIRKKRTQILIDNAKCERLDPRLSPKSKYLFLSDYGRALAVLMGINEWDAALLAGISAQDIEEFLFRVSIAVYDSKIASRQSVRFLKKEEKDKVVHTDVIRNVGNFAWGMLRNKFTLDYGLASNVRYYYGLKKEEVVTAQQQSLWIGSLKKIMNELEVSYSDIVKERTNRKKVIHHKVNSPQEWSPLELAPQEWSHQELAPQEWSPQYNFEEDGYEECFEEDLHIKESAKPLPKINTHKETQLLNNPPPLGAPSSPIEECNKIINDRRIALSKMPHFLYDMMKTNWTNELKIKFSFLPEDFDILAYAI